MVYESGPEDMKKDLVQLLVQQLVEGRKTAAKVTQDTKIFEEGAITTPSGGNLSTYKELCSLASETNQPDLVYKFMHLVNHRAIWDSKKVRKRFLLGFGSFSENVRTLMNLAIHGTFVNCCG